MVLSFLDVVNVCDNCRVHKPSPIPSHFDQEILVPLHLSSSSDSVVIGLLRPVVYNELRRDNEHARQSSRPEMWGFDTSRASRAYFLDWLDTPTKRTEAMEELCTRWRDTGLFPDVCGPTKWRSELYPIYKDPFGLHDHATDSDSANFAFEMERSACALFGFVTYGIHASIYKELETEDGHHDFSIWVPTRSRTKQTWPGLLDNTVAGGVSSGMGMFESLVKECMEEASISESLVRKYAKATGSISYFIRTDKGWLQPEIEYVYDIKIPDALDFVPKPLDGEVESFELMTAGEVKQKMQQGGLFKPNCALVLVDLFVRLGIITPDNEPDYMKIVTRLHGQFEYEQWKNCSSPTTASIH
ncbi:nudix hydrolase 20 [Mycena floridula]|nr:nudix hydrolase 20 [Mycena floridula]